ncbi:hypothetical protein D9M68_547740 [compost metagenome]
MSSSFSASVSLSPEATAKLPCTAARSASASERGACAASSGTIFRRLGLLAMSRSDTLSGLTPGLSVTQPMAARMLSARAAFTGSAGSVTVAPSGTVSSVLWRREYRPMGGVGTCTTGTRSKPCCLLVAFRYSECWKMLASICPRSTASLGCTPWLNSTYLML